MHALCGFRIRDLNNRVTSDLHLKSHGYWNRHYVNCFIKYVGLHHGISWNCFNNNTINEILCTWL